MTESKFVPDSLGWWLWLDGSPRGCAVFLHDPTGDGLQFDSGAVSSETDLDAFDWAGPLILEPRPGLRVASGLPRGPGLWEFGDSVVRVVREPDGSLAFDVATETERLPVDEYRDSPWGGRLVVGQGQRLVMPAGFTIQGGAHEHVVEGGQVGVSCLDSAGYLSATPTGACRRVTETSGGESLTFEDDRRLPAASEADASDLAKLGDLVREMVEGHYGAGRFIIGGLEVDIVDPRYKTKTKAGFSVAVSPDKRPERARSNG